MLTNPVNSILPEISVENAEHYQQGETGKRDPVSMVIEPVEVVFVADSDKSLTKAIGQLQNGLTTHYYSWGNFNLVRLIMYILKQTGPAHVFMTSYSFSQKSIEQLKRKHSLKSVF
jgi:hypothetical protein